MKRIPLSQMGSEFLSRLVERGESVALTTHDVPVAVVMGFDEFRSMAAIVDLAKDPDQLRELLDAHERVQNGDLSEFADLEQLVADK